MSEIIIFVTWVVLVLVLIPIFVLVCNQIGIFVPVFDEVLVTVLALSIADV